ncbi:nuclear transport factor 2 family protein [Neorhizobium lilium]|uniref:Nuclear transport factor 2 family protein n=1 Tax=Neorhizobium lilium TaxID=2503024 RepID=A0A3S3RLU6_9HYPH|nr:nuclear transport factor 2 family protein [Neorhizobium lilium]RWX81652.1 nuclear transport factor 2 family protein [Neorhizobium lilium]
MQNADTVVDAFYRAYNDHDADAVVGLYAHGARHEEIAFGSERHGHEDLRKGLSGLFTMMPDVHWRERERIRSAAHVAVLYEMTGTFTPKLKEGVPPQAPPKSVSLIGLHVLEIADGLISVSRDYWDKAEFFAQIA